MTRYLVLHLLPASSPRTLCGKGRFASQRDLLGTPDRAQFHAWPNPCRRCAARLATIDARKPVAALLPSGGTPTDE